MVCGRSIDEWRELRPLSEFTAYFDPLTGFAYSHTELLAEEVKSRLIPVRAYESHSKRAFFIVSDGRIIEYKGLTLPRNEIVRASGQPFGLLLRENGRREEKALNSLPENNVHAEYIDVGKALIIRRDENDVSVIPINDAPTNEQHMHEIKHRECNGDMIDEIERIVNKSSKSNSADFNDADGEIKVVRYGILKRYGDDYLPFIRLDLFDIVRKLAIDEKNYVNMLSEAMRRLGRTLRRAHEIGIFHCFTHPGNIDIHGNIVDFEHAIFRYEIPRIRAYNEEVDEMLLRFRDIDLFFAGSRDVLARCEHVFRVKRRILITKIKYLRENISITQGIPVLETLAHINIGFYEDTIRALEDRYQRKIIGAFVDGYRGDSSIADEVFKTIKREGEWTEQASGIIVDPSCKRSWAQISSDFILKLWELGVVGAR